MEDNIAKAMEVCLITAVIVVAFTLTFFQYKQGQKIYESAKDLVIGDKNNISEVAMDFDNRLRGYEVLGEILLDVTVEKAIISDSEYKVIDDSVNEQQLRNIIDLNGSYSYEYVYNSLGEIVQKRYIFQ